MEGSVVGSAGLRLRQHVVGGFEHDGGVFATAFALAEQVTVDGVPFGRGGDALADLAWITADLLLDGHPHPDGVVRRPQGSLPVQPCPAVWSASDAIGVMRDVWLGRLGRAEIRADRYARRDSHRGVPDAAERHVLQIAAIRWYQGRIAECLPMLAEVAGPPGIGTPDRSILGMFALAAAAAGEQRQAGQALARLRLVDESSLPYPGGWPVALFAAAETAYLLEDCETAAAVYRLLLPYADRPAVAGLGAVCLGSVQHALGLAALVQGEPECAVAHLTAAVYANLVLGHRPAVVIARARLAEALDRRDQPADSERSALERQLAARDAAELGMPGPDLAWPPSAAAGCHCVGIGSYPVACRSVGRQWEITMGRHSVRIGRMRGMQYLAVLIANPGHEIRAIELAQGPGSVRETQVRTEHVSAQPLLDGTALREYRRQLADLDDQIERHTSQGAVDRADQLHGEREWLLAELAAATGFAGRSRTFPTNDERARIAVGKAIRRAMDHITSADPALGRHLRATVHTGVRCVYQP